MSTTEITDGGPSEAARERVLTRDAVAFLAELHARFGTPRLDLLRARAGRPAPRGFLAETDSIRREDSWRVPPPRPDYEDRRVEITGPTDRKLIINALNSGAKGFMADFEDASSPTWHNQIEGQLNLIDAVDGTISYDGSDGRHYKLDDAPATLIVRPRGWHLPEKHMCFDGVPMGGGLTDFGLYAFHCAGRLAERGRGTYLYLPKLEHHLEARLWKEVFDFTRAALGLAPGLIRATILIETLPAAFQMDEMLHALGGYSYGLNAGRWDYIFSMIKCFRDDPSFVLPDRGDVKMTVPFMRAYAELLVKTCHARGAFAMGGMAALVPSRSDLAVNERAIDAVREDKRREAADGFDGTWVAHPDVVDVAMAEFDAALGTRPNQIDRRRDDVHVTAEQLLDVARTPGEITESGLRNDVSVAFQYISFWLGGRGAAGIDNMMEDAATAEICRSQLWQWIRHGKVTRARVLEILAEEMQAIHERVGDDLWHAGNPERTRTIFEHVALADDLPEFLTISAYEYLD